MLAVFVYGTLRPGSWNHDRGLAPWLAAPCRPATLAGFALHHLDGLPYVVPSPDRSVAGDAGELVDAAALAILDDFEGVDAGHYTREAVTLDDGTTAWVWVAGPLVTGRLGPATLVDGGDWLAVA